MHRAFLLASILLLPFGSPVQGAESHVLISDTFTIKEGDRAASSSLGGQSVEKGGAIWKKAGDLIVAPEGWVTSSGSGGSVGAVALPALDGTVTLEADVIASKCGFAALAFMTTGNLNFWGDTPIWMTLWPGGKCELRDAKNVLYTIDAAPGFKKDDFNHVELIYDTKTNTVSLQLNGALLADKKPLEQKPAITAACFRLQEPLTPNIPAIDNFKVTQGGAPPTGKVAGPVAPPQAPMIKPSRPIPELIGKPIWSSDVVTNEPVLFIDSGEGPVARLLFAPEEIIAISSSNLEEDYQIGNIAFKAGSNVVTLPAGSPLPSLKLEELYLPPSTKGSIKAARGERAAKFGPDRWLRFGESPGPYFSKQVLVTYKHKGKWNGYQPGAAEAALQRTVEKLRNKQPVKVVVLGDSISAGCFGSANLKCAPFQPPYSRLVTEGLKSAYGGEVNLLNISKGGALSEYALSQIPLLIAEKPDLLILAFGMNDGSSRIPAAKYSASIDRVVKETRKEVPNLDVILVSTILGNPEWTGSAPDLYPGYREALKAMIGPGTAIADVTTLSEDVLKTKEYADITVNGVNHPNDFAHRLYAQTILELLKAN